MDAVPRARQGGDMGPAQVARVLSTRVKFWVAEVPMMGTLGLGP